jgi:hypothetical protein
MKTAKFTFLTFILFLNIMLIHAQSNFYVYEYKHDSINVRLDDFPFALTKAELNLPTKGKVIARMEGDCISSFGDNITFGVSNTAWWGSNFGNMGIRLFDSVYTQNRYYHTMSFDVEKGEHVFSAYAHNWTDRNGTGIISVKGNLILEFFPEAEEESRHTFKNISVYPYNINENAKLLDSISVTASGAAKILFTFNGRFYSRADTEVEIALNDAESMEGNEDSYKLYVPHSRKLPNFSKHIIRQVGPGEHHFMIMCRKLQGNMTDTENAFYGTITATVFYDESEMEAVLMEKINLTIPASNTASNAGKLNWDVPAKGTIMVSYSGTASLESGDKLNQNLNVLSQNLNEVDFIEIQPNHPSERETFFTINRVYAVEKGDIQIDLLAASNRNTGQHRISADMVLKYYADPVVSSASDFQLNNLELEIFPNPASDFVHVKMNESGFSGKTKVRVYDNMGHLVKAFEIVNSTHDVLDVSEIKEGIYFLEVQKDRARSINKFVKIK